MTIRMVDIGRLAARVSPQVIGPGRTGGGRLAAQEPVSYPCETLTPDFACPPIFSNVSNSLSETRFGSNGSWRGGA